MKVPLFDLTRQYASLREEILEKMDEVMSSGRVILGPNVKEIERKISEYVGAKHAVAVASGSDALLIALHAMGVKPGDHVVTTPYTFFATVSSILRLGATPVFADVGEDFNIDLDHVERIIESDPKVKVVIPVHIFGKSVDMQRLTDLCSAREIKILEDAAQSIGSEAIVGGKRMRTSSIGDAGIFSFFPTKNLGAYGDAGMVVTNSPEIAERVSILRVHGAKAKYVHEEIGYNSRMDEMQAVVLNVKMARLDGWIDSRREIAKRYADLFGEIGSEITVPEVPGDRSHVFHQYVVKAEKRDELREFLKEKGIGTSIYYPVPLHLQKCFASLGYKSGDLPVSERFAKETLALPIFPEITCEEQEYVVNAVHEFYKGESK